MKKRKTNMNQISDSKKFNLSRCQRNANTTKASGISDSKKFKLSKKKSVHTCKGKSIVEMDNSQGSILSQQDLLREILSWLPVPSLLRFKCVAKSWDVTSDPYFTMKHQRVNSLRFLLFHSNCNNTPALCNLYSTSSLSSPEDVENIDYLSSNNNPSFRILCGSCDGLVVIQLVTNNLLLLWNPLTRESIPLPFPIFGTKNSDSSFGLGYDPKAHDYKILTIHNDKSQIQCAILALKSGSWRNVHIEAPHIFRTSRIRFGLTYRLAFLHGAFHWIHCRYWVVSFNISNEVYTEIPLLDQMKSYLSVHKLGNYLVSVLDGMLCFSYTVEVGRANTFMLWAMKDYGVKESWTQLFKIKVPRQSVARPIYRFPDGDVLFHCHDVIGDSLRTSKGRFRLWSDSLLKRLSKVDIITYNESLISPKSLI